MAKFEEMEDRTNVGLNKVIEKVMEGLGAKIDGVVTTVNGVADRIGNLETSLRGIKTDIKSLDDRLIAVESRDGADCEDKVVRELSEIEAKKKNILIFGLPEPSSSDRVSPRDKDTQVVDSLIERVAGKKVAFDVRFRIGKKDEGKIRPIVVALRDERDKESILRGSSKLKDSNDWQHVYIRPDLTKAQREFMKKQEEQLKVEAASKNSLLKNGETWEWKIRGRGLVRYLAKVPFRD